MRRPLNFLRSTVVRDGIRIGAGQVVAIAGRLVGTRLLTTLLAPSAYGALNLGQGLVTFASSFLCGPIVHAAYRFHPDAVVEDRVREFRTLLGRLLTRRLLLAVALILSGGALWTFGMGRDGSFALFLVMGAFAAIEVPRSFELALLNASRVQGRYAAWEATDAWAKPLGGATAIGLAGATPAGALAGITATTAAVYALFRLRRGAPVDRPPDEAWIERQRKVVLAFAIPMIPLAILGWVTSYSDRYIVGGLAGLSEAGIYAAAYGLGSQPFLALAGFLHTTLRPVLFEALARGDAARARRTLAAWFLIISGGSAIGVVLMWLLARPLVALLLGPAFADGARLIPWIAGAFAFQNVQQVFETVIYARRRTGRLVVMQAAGSVVAVILYFVLIPRLGSLGAAIATFISLAASCAAAAILSEIHRPWETP